MQATSDRDLKNLNAFLNVVFALAFFRIFEFLPAFADQHWLKLPYGLVSLLVSSPANLTRVVFGLIVIVYFWLRKNAVIRLLEGSNASFATLAIASLAFILLFMYAFAADPMYVGGPPTLLLQSVSFLIASLLGYWSFRYAIHAGLVPPSLRPAAEQAARADLANPLTAIVATALSWSGLIIWTLSWFVLMPIFSVFLARGSKRPASH